MSGLVLMLVGLRGAYWSGQKDSVTEEVSCSVDSRRVTLRGSVGVWMGGWSREFGVLYVV